MCSHTNRGDDRAKTRIGAQTLLRLAAAEGSELLRQLIESYWRPEIKIMLVLPPLVLMGGAVKNPWVDPVTRGLPRPMPNTVRTNYGDKNAVIVWGHENPGNY